MRGSGAGGGGRVCSALAPIVAYGSGVGMRDIARVFVIVGFTIGLDCGEPRMPLVHCFDHVLLHSP